MDFLSGRWKPCRNNPPERSPGPGCVCTVCPVCRAARRNQKGLLYSFVKTIEGRFCPFCMAYEKVTEEGPRTLETATAMGSRAT
jgi:hypothetical protein